MHALCGRLPALTWVDLEGVKSLTAGGLRAVGGLTAPTWLHLSDCSNVGMGCSLPLPTAGRVLVWPHGRGKSHHLNSSHPPTPACTHPSTLQCSPVGQLPMLAEEEEEEDALEEEGVTAADRPSKAKRRDSGVLPPNNPPRAAPRSIPRAHPSSELSFTQLTHTHTHTHITLSTLHAPHPLSQTTHSFHPSDTTRLTHGTHADGSRGQPSLNSHAQHAPAATSPHVHPHTLSADPTARVVHSRVTQSSLQQHSTTTGTWTGRCRSIVPPFHRCGGGAVLEGAAST